MRPTWIDTHCNRYSTAHSSFKGLLPRAENSGDFSRPGSPLKSMIWIHGLIFTAISLQLNFNFFSGPPYALVWSSRWKCKAWPLRSAHVSPWGSVCISCTSIASVCDVISVGPLQNLQRVYAHLAICHLQAANQPLCPSNWGLRAMARIML